MNERFLIIFLQFRIKIVKIRGIGLLSRFLSDKKNKLTEDSVEYKAFLRLSNEGKNFNLHVIMKEHEAL